MSRRMVTAASLALGLLLCACSPRAKLDAPAVAKRFKVALLTPGPVSDAGWNAAAFDGLRLIKNRLDAETAMVQTNSPADFEDALRDFASRGFNLIFAHGFEYTDAALRVARHFPHTMFIVTSGAGAAANVASLAFKIEQAAYVEGVLAGGMSKSGVAGAVGGIELPAIRLTFNGFREGFLSAHPGGRVLISFTGSFEDVGAAKEAALAQISQGADFLFHNADAAGLGVFEAARKRGVFAFGANRNQNAVMPEAILASAVTDIPRAFLKIAREVEHGGFRPGMIELGMKDGMVRVVYNPVLRSKIPPTVMGEAEAARKRIAGGKIRIASERAGG